ncbi:MAG: leucine-rich repeat domain-containing protein, partial [Clostridia bacterium]|nr:leucine-rich repeat domain-containing protein [Clostridia bacterium]
TATITARPTHWADKSNDFIFYVTVEGSQVNSFIEEISVGSVYNHTKDTTRSVTGGGISVDCGSELTLYPSFKPWYVTEIPDLTWQLSDPEMAEIVSSNSESARVICKKTGAVAVLMSSATHGVIGTFTIVIGDEYTMTSYYLREYKGTGYSETYMENGVERKMLVIPANLGIVVMGSYYSSGGMRYDGTFEDVKGLDTVVVPEGVTNIGSYCFSGTSIRRIYLPSSLESISAGAFMGTPLEEVYWYEAGKDSKSGIEYDADDNTYNWDVFYANASDECTSKNLILQGSSFSSCRSLKTFDFSRVSVMYAYAFSGCSSLEYANLSNLRMASNNIFNNCSKLSSVTMNKDTVLSRGVFAGTALTELDYYGSVIKSGMFMNMKSLRKIVIHNDVETIGAEAFSGCSNLATIEWKGTYKEIGASAFKNCTSLTSVTIPAGVEKLGDTIFEGCSSLQTVLVSPESNIISIGLNSFKGCSALKKVQLVNGESSDRYNTVNSGNYAMLTNANGTKIVMAPPAYPLTTTGNVFNVPAQFGAAAITEIGAYSYANNISLTGKEVVIPEGVTKIGKAAFRDTSITKVVIPSTVTEIEEYAFANCEKLQTVIFLCELQEIPAYAFYNCKVLMNVQLPGSVERIGDHAFQATDVREVLIGENVRSIGMEAFRDCVSLAMLNFAEHSVLHTIGQAAFGGCVSLKTVEMPDTVTVLKNSAFVGCATLTTVYVSAGLEVMEGYVFSACPLMSTFTMGDGAKMLGDYAFYTPYGNNGFYYQPNLKNVTSPDSVESIGQFAFAGNTAMDMITLNGVRTIGDYAFHYATALEEVVTTDVLERIGLNAFVGSGIQYIDLFNVEYFGDQCFLGTDIYVPNSGNLRLTNAIEIGKGAFYNCKNIKKVTLTNVVSIGDMAFGAEAQSNITEVSLGNKLVSMGATVFYNAPISYIVLPETLSEIATPAFTGCTSLQRISVTGKNKTFFVDSEFGGLYRKLENGTYELVSVPNNIRMMKIDEDYKNLEPFKI